MSAAAPQEAISMPGNQARAADIAVDALEFLHEVVRKNSLSRSGQRLALGLMGGMTLTVGVSITLLCGAWPVLPFAGLEIVALWFAFRWLAGHDGDYERITVRGSALQHETCVRQRIRRQQWNRHWSTLMHRSSGCRVDLHIRSHGREAEIGRMMMDEDRTALADALRTLLRVQKITR